MDYSKDFEIPPGITYFDSAASSLTCKAALQKMSEYYQKYRSNIHRGQHRLTKQASDEYEGVYSTLAKFFGAKEEEFISVRNCTEAINGVSLGINFKEGDEIITTDIEHHSNFLPWLRLKEKGVKIKILKAGNEGQITPES
ncbi:MAG: aminotransferase class V-fold PLP-dependent enzyme, partial [Candidatus Micrarchaeota archaeon]